MNISQLNERFNKLLESNNILLVHTEYGIGAILNETNGNFHIEDLYGDIITVQSKDVYEVLDDYINGCIMEEAGEDLLMRDDHFFNNKYSQYIYNKLKEMTYEDDNIQESHTDIITVEEMRDLHSILMKLSKVVSSAYKDGDFDRSNFIKLNNAIRIIDKAYGLNSHEIDEELRLADRADADLGLGDFYMVDNKQELISAIDKLTIGDSIGIIQGDHEVTITLQDEDNYDLVSDNGMRKDNWELADNGPIFTNINKEDLIKAINLTVRA